MAYISRLMLSDFRCYTSETLTDVQNGFVVLYGDNGAGKTNILEAVSLLTPGRGIRGARIADMQRHVNAASKTLEATSPWAISAKLATTYGEVNIGTGLDPDSVTTTPKRTVRINGETQRGRASLAEHLSCVWLTPQMDGLFIGSSSERRRFLDRLVFAFNKGHAGRLTRYQNALSQRSKLLKEGRGEAAWLSGLEAQIAEAGVAIAAARIDLKSRLSEARDDLIDNAFPRAKLDVKGTLENLLTDTPALEVEDIFKAQLADSRGVDMLTGGAATGPHKSDLKVTYIDKNMPAAHCSTGEQKALLIGIILAYARLVSADGKDKPILLLDEVAAHLDHDRRENLYDILRDIGGQVWLTGTDRNLFSSLEKEAQFFEISGGHASEIDAQETRKQAL